MKHLFMAVVALFFASNTTFATNFTLAIANVDTAYAHYLIGVAVVDTDQAHLTGLGARPTPPVQATTGTDWSTYVASAATYDSSYTAVNDSLFEHTGAARTLELSLMATLGYGSVLQNPCVNQWVKVQGASFSTAWIGYSSTSSYISIVGTLPTKAFPNH